MSSLRNTFKIKRCELINILSNKIYDISNIIMTIEPSYNEKVIIYGNFDFKAEIKSKDYSQMKMFIADEKESITIYNFTDFRRKHDGNKYVTEFTAHNVKIQKVGERKNNFVADLI